MNNTAVFRSARQSIRCVVCSRSFVICVFLLFLLYFCAPYQLPTDTSNVTLLQIMFSSYHRDLLGTSFELTSYGAFLKMQDVPWSCVVFPAVCAALMLRELDVLLRSGYAFRQIRNSKTGYMIVVLSVAATAPFLCLLLSKMLYGAAVWLLLPDGQSIAQQLSYQMMCEIYGTNPAERLRFVSGILLNDFYACAFFGTVTVWLFPLFQKKRLIVSVYCLVNYGSVKLCDQFMRSVPADMRDSSLVSWVQTFFPHQIWTANLTFYTDTGIRFAFYPLFLAAILLIPLLCIRKYFRNGGCFA